MDRAHTRTQRVPGRDGLPRLLRTPLSLFRHCFERLRTDTAQMAVSTGAIVEGLNVLVDLGRSNLTGRVDSLPNPLLLQTAKK